MEEIYCRLSSGGLQGIVCGYLGDSYIAALRALNGRPLGPADLRVAVCAIRADWGELWREYVDGKTAGAPELWEAACDGHLSALEELARSAPIPPHCALISAASDSAV